MELQLWLCDILGAPWQSPVATLHPMFSAGVGVLSLMLSQTGMLKTLVSISLVFPSTSDRFKCVVRLLLVMTCGAGAMTPHRCTYHIFQSQQRSRVLCCTVGA